MYKNTLTKNFLHDEIINKQKQPKDLAHEINVHPNTIRKYLRKFNIKRKKSASNFKDLTNKEYGMLTVLRRDHLHGKKLYWLCKCKCGKEKPIAASSLTRGLSKSCSCNIANSRYRGYEDVSKTYFKQMKQGAVSRNLQFDITMKDVWDQYIRQNKKCMFSGVDIQFSKSYNNGQTASVDRIDSSKGYTKDNIQIVHKLVNRMKQDLSDQDFIYWCKLIANNN
jgi:hypothetical protein